MSLSLSPVFQEAQRGLSDEPANLYKIHTFAAGTSTPVPVFRTMAGDVPHSNPIVLNSRGEPPDLIWITDGLKVDFQFASPGDTSPPTSPIRTLPNVSGIGDTAATSQAVSEWITTGLTPTFISATSFSLPGNQTALYEPKRRIKAILAGSTVYGKITTSVFTTSTLVTVVLDSGVLDASLSRVDIGITSAANTSLPVLIQPGIEFIETRTFSAVNVVDFVPTAGQLAKYKMFRFRIEPTTTTPTGVPGNVLRLRLSRDGGTTYDGGSTDYVGVTQTYNLTGTTLVFANAGGTQVSLIGCDVGSFIFAPFVDVELSKGYVEAKIYCVSSGQKFSAEITAQKTTAAVHNAVRFLPTVGSITGSISWFGVI